MRSDQASITRHTAPHWVQSLQGYLAHKRPPEDPTVGSCPGPYGGPRGMGVLL